MHQRQICVVRITGSLVFAAHLIFVFIDIMNKEDSTVAAAVASCIPEIARTIDLIADRVRKGGRVIYIGAGTSGRLTWSYLSKPPLIKKAIILSGSVYWTLQKCEKTCYSIQ